MKDFLETSFPLDEKNCHWQDKKLVSTSRNEGLAEKYVSVEE